MQVIPVVLGITSLLALCLIFILRRRLGQLMRAMGRFAGGQTDVRLGWSGKDILSRTGMQFNYMVTRLEQERAHLTENEERLRFALYDNSAGIWDWRIDQNRTYYSPRWLHLLGYAEDELPPQTDERFKRVHPDDLPGVMRLLNAHLAGEQDFYESEHRLRHRDGGYRWVRERGRALRDEAGRAVRMVGVLADIDAQKRAEDALAKSNRERDAILSLSPEGFVFADAAGTVSYVNPAFLQMTGFAAAQIVGAGETALEGMLADLCDPEKPPSPHGVAADVREDRLTLVKPEKRILKRLTVSLRAEPGAPPGRIMFFQDITQAVELDRMKSAFLSAAAHELRTPLSNILGFADLLLAREHDAKTRQEFHEIIQRQTRKLIELINDLLDLARIEARGEKCFDFRTQPLAPLIENAVAAQYVPPQTHRLELELPPALPAVNVDADKLQQVLTNVLGNAVKYSPRGGTIRVATLNETPGRVGIVVSDPGLGMTPEQQARIFERFYRAGTDKSIPGTGLGMCLVKEIMTVMAGEVAVSSHPGQGTAITLWLPAHASGES